MLILFYFELYEKKTPYLRKYGVKINYQLNIIFFHY